MSDAVLTLWRRAPTSIMALSSLVLSYLATRAAEDYVLYMALGAGGLGKPGLMSWLVHTIVLRPLALAKGAATDPNYLPLDDEEWEKAKVKQARESNPGDNLGLNKLSVRSIKRPLVYGVVPQRQVEAIAKEGSEMQRAIIAHLQELTHKFPLALELALSAYEKSTSPCLFVRHVSPHEQRATSSGGFAQPLRMARMYLAGTPMPAMGLDKQPLPRDPSKHELVHIHLSDGSIHLTLSPQDARLVVGRNWGELHRLAGIAYRGTYMPPYWLPTWLGNSSTSRWSYQRRQLQTMSSDADVAGRLVPPTYTLVYAPRNQDDVVWVKRIIDASVSWAIGRPV